MNPIDILRAEIRLELRPSPSRQVYSEFVGGVLVGIAVYQRMAPIVRHQKESFERTKVRLSSRLIRSLLCSPSAQDLSTEPPSASCRPGILPTGLRQRR